jgi:hypothetical protein
MSFHDSRTSWLRLGRTAAVTGLTRGRQDGQQMPDDLDSVVRQAMAEWQLSGRRAALSLISTALSKRRRPRRVQVASADMLS